ncbi:MAG: hypothetical protein WBG18_19080 [Xanthobacteraceae bacterium]|jgi:hypothetical protein
MDHRRKRNGRGVNPLVHAGEVSRRAIVAGTVAMTAVAAVPPLTDAAYAESAEGPDADMMAFLLLSEALTGVSRQTLAPELVENKSEILNSDPGIDPINIKNAYFAWINANDATSSFGKLLQLAKDNRQSLGDIIPKVNGSAEDIKFLARSIVLLWYLGSWYKPDDLKNNVASPKVVSPKAYTQGLVWQIAGAHPMGYSNLQFGYWSRDPHDPTSPGLFNPAKP